MIITKSVKKPRAPGSSLLVCKQIDELKDAGWVRINLTTWEAPCRCSFRGPAGAWRVMQVLNAQNCPNHY